MKNESAYPSVFAMRALCAALVVLAHSTLPGQEFLMPLVRIAVPLFFMISGFFIWSPSRAGVQDKIIRKIKDIGWIIIYANGAYLLLAIIMRIFDPQVVMPLSSFKSWLLFVFCGTGVCIPFWYLTAYLETLLVFLIAFRLRRENALMIIGPMMILVNLSLGMYGFAFGAEEIPYSLKVNFLMQGMPFFWTGYAIQEYMPQIMGWITPRRSSWLAGGMIVAAFCEMALLRSLIPGTDTNFSNTVYLTTLPLSASLFIWCLMHSNAGRGTQLERIGRRYTLDLYLWHYAFFLLLFTFWRTPFVQEWSYVIILPGSLLFAIGVGRLRRHLALREVKLAR